VRVYCNCTVFFWLFGCTCTVLNMINVRAESTGLEHGFGRFGTLSPSLLLYISDFVYFVPIAPVLRLAHNSGVASLAWMKNGDILAVGCTQRNIQIYDLRIQGTSAPPISTNAHDNAVHGIKVDPTSDLFATFSRGSVGEPVKLWDMRRMDSCVSEIKLDSKRYSGAELASSDLPSVADIGWDTSARGVLSIATNESLKFYDTRINPSRPTLIRMTNSRSSIQSLAFHPQPLRVQRMLAVSVDGYVSDLPLHEVAPVSISSRDGRISSASGGVVWAGSPVEGKDSY